MKTCFLKHSFVQFSEQWFLVFLVSWKLIWKANRLAEKKKGKQNISREDERQTDYKQISKKVTISLGWISIKILKYRGRANCYIRHMSLWVGNSFGLRRERVTKFSHSKKLYELVDSLLVNCGRLSVNPTVNSGWTLAWSLVNLVQTNYMTMCLGLYRLPPGGWWWWILSPNKKLPITVHVTHISKVLKTF